MAILHNLFVWFFFIPITSYSIHGKSTLLLRKKRKVCKEKKEKRRRQPLHNQASLCVSHFLYVSELFEIGIRIYGGTVCLGGSYGFNRCTGLPQLAHTEILPLTILRPREDKICLVLDPGSTSQCYFWCSVSLQATTSPKYNFHPSTS